MRRHNPHVYLASKIMGWSRIHSICFICNMFANWRIPRDPSCDHIIYNFGFPGGPRGVYWVMTSCAGREPTLVGIAACLPSTPMLT